MTQFIKFSLVGVVNTLIHYGVFYGLYQFFDVYHLLASTAGFLFAVSNSYFMNKYWTFKGEGLGGCFEFFRFLMVSVLALFLNLLTMWTLVELLSFYPPVAQLLAIALTLVVNFLGNKFWSFRGA